MASTSSAQSAMSLGPVLVTGGCGFIGFHIVSGILKREPECQIHLLTSTLNSPAAQPKTIFHVACPDSTVQQPEVFQRVNVGGARNLLASAKRTKGFQAFVNTFTSSVIHDNLTDLFDADETFPVLKYPQQKRIYTLTKAEAEGDILAANRADGDSSMLTVSMRPATAFGERDTVCMGKIVANARAGKGKYQMGPGGNFPPQPQDVRVDGESFNVTNNEPVYFWEFQRAIGASVGLPIKKEEIKVIPIWFTFLMATISEWTTWIRTWGKQQPIVTREAVQLTTITRTLKGEKARRILGYEPKVSMSEGLERAGKWFVEEAARADDTRKTV
ncbi:hypothetical protein JX266_007012 [Neoarthrinium moseri]|nr:hypothetical protein JX266_007012 [Neoarthrinium moseri]